MKTVAQLIEVLKACNQNALIVVNVERLGDDWSSHHEPNIIYFPETKHGPLLHN